MHLLRHTPTKGVDKAKNNSELKRPPVRQRDPFSGGLDELRELVFYIEGQRAGGILEGIGNPVNAIRKVAGD